MRQLILTIITFVSLGANAQNNLDYYIKTAQQNSPLVNTNKNLSKANLLEAKRLKAFYTKPQIGVSVSYLFSPIISTDNNKIGFKANAENANNYYGYDLAYSNGGNYQAMLNITQPLLNNKRYKTASEQLKISAQINENRAQLNKHDIEKIVIDQYILCLQDIEQTKYAQKIIKILSDQKKILEKLVESGIYKQSDLILLNINHQDFLAQLTSFKANYYRDLMDLNILCGINDTTLIQLQKIELTLNNNNCNAMFLEQYRLDSLNLIAQQKAFELKYKPQLNIIANTGFNAVYAPTILQRLGVSAGFNFSYNFFDGKQKDINQNKTEVLEQSVSFNKTNFINQNSIRKSKILAELLSYSERILIAEQQLKDYDLLFDNYKREIMSGQLSIINYITVLKSMSIIKRDYILLFSQQQSLINTYNYWNW